MYAVEPFDGKFKNLSRSNVTFFTLSLTFQMFDFGNVGQGLVENIYLAPFTVFLFVFGLFRKRCDGNCKSKDARWRTMQ